MSMALEFEAALSKVIANILFVRPKSSTTLIIQSAIFSPVCATSITLDNAASNYRAMDILTPVLSTYADSFLLHQ